MGRGGTLGQEPGDVEVVDRRALRQEYRKLYVDAVAGKEQLEDASGTALRDMLNKMEQLRNHVEKPREHAVDAGVFCHLAEAGLTMVTRGQAVNKGRTPGSLIAMLRQAYGGDAAESSAPLRADGFAWDAMGAGASGFIAPAPGLGCMLGPLDTQPKARAAAAAPRRKRAAEVATGEVVRARELEDAELGTEEKQETDRNMLTMFRALQRCGGSAAFAPLVLNPSSFSQTVENIFTLSFLVRDRKVRLCRDTALGVVARITEGHPSGGPKAPKAAAAGAPGGGSVQLMLSYSMSDWDVMVAAIPASECVMPHRAHHAAAGGGGGAVAAGAAARRPAAGGRQGRGAPDDVSDQRAVGEEDDEEEGSEEPEVPARANKRSRRSSGR